MPPLRVIAKRALLATAVGLGTGGCLYFLHKNDWSPSHVGIVRFARAGLTATATIADYKWTLLGLGPETQEYREQIRGCHQRGADRLLALARRNGGVFIKVGQHIAALQYLLPEPYTTTLSVLHSKAPESSLEEIRAVFRASLHRELDDVFHQFDVSPCGAASLAQVHKARLNSTGEWVAVKVQHPQVKARSYVDMATMEFFVSLASLVFPNLKLQWLVNETKRNLPKELDFLHEAENAERARQMFAHLPFVKIPKIHYDLSTDTVLTMEYCEGGQVNDLDYYRERGMNPNTICRLLGRLYSEMIFTHGYVHSDPHPGNVLVRRNEQSGREELVLLDHGLYATLPDEVRINYAQLWLALLKPDKEEMRRACERLNVGQYFGLFACIVTMRSWKAVSEGIVRRSRRDPEEEGRELSHIQEFAASLIPQISEILDSMPRQMLLILKTNDLLRSISYKLGAGHRLTSFTEMSKYCTRAVYRHSIRASHSLLQNVRLHLCMWILLLKIQLYEYFLIANELFVRRS